MTVGTVLEGTHVPISKWLMALFLLCSSKKSLRANQLHRLLGVTYKTAGFLCRRLRFAMTPNHWAEPKLAGTVAGDETCVGGKGDRRTKGSRKTPGVALLQRLGRVRVKVVASVTQKNLGAALAECVSQEAVVNTHEPPGYKRPLKPWKANQTVNHSRGEFYRRPRSPVARLASAKSRVARGWLRCLATASVRERTWSFS